MAFKLAAHLAQQATHPHHSAAAGLAGGAAGPARQIASSGLAASATDAIRFSALPGFGSTLPQAWSNDESNAAAQQLKISQDTYALMNGPGINVIVKNLDQQSKFS